MPEGFEFTESINGVVSVRRIDPRRRRAPAAHVELVREEAGRWKHLGRHRVEARDGTIVLYEPVGGLSEATAAEVAGLLGTPLEVLQARLGGRFPPVRYDPVLRFVPQEPGGGDEYCVERMTYRGEGGWWYLSGGKLADLVRAYVRQVGTEAFFDLM